ncbi:odorant receptor 10-like isoform X2 [Temnothorax longispinosus]|uniref:odorant receptor 10-like isoform X2 n=1 Tax=Temnothorax longispinosus TaxID=300112 RepID=UPI003A99D5F5
MTAIMSRNDDMVYAFAPHKFLTLPLGVWPLQKYNVCSAVRAFVCSFGLTVMMIMLFLEIFLGSVDTTVKLDSLMLMSCNILSVLKLVFFRIYADNLIRNFTSAANDYLAVDTEEKRTIMRRHAFMGRMMCYSILFFAYFAATIFGLLPVLAGGDDIQVNESIKNQASELPMPLTCIFGNSSVPSSLYLAVSTVQYVLLMLNANGNCVLASRHRYLIEHTELLIDVISFVLLVQMLFSSILICIMGFQFILALKHHDVVTITKTTTVLGALLLQLFSYSFAGDYLKCQMEEVANSIYTCNWYNLPLKLMRNVAFAIMRSQQPVQLLAGRFFVVNIETYMTILKSSISYLSVLRVMVDT